MNLDHLDPTHPLPDTPNPARVAEMRRHFEAMLPAASDRPMPLVLTDQRVQELRDHADQAPAEFQPIIDRARLYLDGEPLPMLWYGEGADRHMLETSREAFRRCTDLALAWRLTSEADFIALLSDVLDAAAGLDNWNSRHFLDTAEMMGALALGLAWAWDGLDENVRSRVVEALRSKGLAPSQAAYHEDWPHLPWRALRNNWNIVCNTGVTLGALACAHADRDACVDLLGIARASVETGLWSFGPEGAYPEGTIYWGYATKYLALMASAYSTAFGQDIGLMGLPGVSRTAEYPARLLSPTGHTVCFGDQDLHSRDSHRALSLFFFARAQDKPEYATPEHAYLREHPETITPLHAVWRPEPVAEAVTPHIADRLEGPTPLAIFRQRGDGSSAAFLSLKGGWNPESHGHLDLGTLEYHALGKRWFIDLGRDDYRLPGYWQEFDPQDASQPGARFDWFRCSTFSHNVPTFNGQSQRVRVVSAMSDLSRDGDLSTCEVDLSPAYGHPVQRLVRRVEFNHATGEALVRDAFTLAEPARVDWTLLTEAQPRVEGLRVELELQGESTTLEIEASEGAALRVESAEQEPPQAPNPGIVRLVCGFAAPAGASLVTARIAPTG